MEAALKRTRLLFNSEGEIIDAERVRSLILEIRVLSHPPLKGDANIVDILGIAWEEGHSAPNDGQLWPLLIMPYAYYGSLSDFLEKHKDCEAGLRINFGKGVGQGLHHLHSCGVVHGDVKCENILLYPQGERIIAKIADFGHAVVMSATKPWAQLPGGTPPWNAPEWQKTLRKEDLCLTDVYSYGLLVWRIIMHPTPVLEDVFFLFAEELCTDFEDEHYVVVHDLEQFKKKIEFTDFIVDRCESSASGQSFITANGLNEVWLRNFFTRTVSCDAKERDIKIAFGSWYESPLM